LPSRLDLVGVHILNNTYGKLMNYERSITMKSFIIGLVVIIVLAGLVLAATGVLHVQNTENKAGITIDKKELEQQAGEAVDKTKEAGSKLLDKTSKELHKAGESLKASSKDRQEPAKTEPSNTTNTPQPMYNE
jgi:hypothetical protein